MLDKTDFASWKQLYSDPSHDEKDRYNADIRATNIILQGLPKDIYSLINHYTDAKDIWDNVKMLLEGLELTKEDRESQLYDDFEHFRQNKGETIHDYYVRFTKLINDMRNIKMTMSKIQLNLKFVNNMLPEWGRFVTAVKLNKGLKDSNFDQLYAYLKLHKAHAHRQNRGQGNNARGAGAVGYGRAQNRINHVPKLSCEQDNAIDEDVDEQPVQDLALNVDNVFQADDYLVVDKDHPSYDSDILSEVQDHDHFQDAICEHHEEHGMQDDVQPSYVVGSHADYTSDSNTISQYISSKWYQRSAIIQNNASNGSQIDDDKTEDER
ncbi:hypothetical protein Tco_0265158 [Tanacetum coccineum]